MSVSLGNPVVGTELKVNINITPISDLHMSDYDFNATFYTKASKILLIHKKDMIKIDDDNYIALVDSSVLGSGNLKVLINAQLPDNDFPDSHRTEIVRVDTGITISK